MPVQPVEVLHQKVSGIATDGLKKVARSPPYGSVELAEWPETSAAPQNITPTGSMTGVLLLTKLKGPIGST